MGETQVPLDSEGNGNGTGTSKRTATNDASRSSPRTKKDDPSPSAQKIRPAVVQSANYGARPTGRGGGDKEVTEVGLDDEEEEEVSPKKTSASEPSAGKDPVGLGPVASSSSEAASGDKRKRSEDQASLADDEGQPKSSKAKASTEEKQQVDDIYDKYWNRIRYVYVSEMEHSEIAKNYGCQAIRLHNGDDGWASLLGDAIVGMYHTRDEAVKRAVCAALMHHELGPGNEAMAETLRSKSREKDSESKPEEEAEAGVTVRGGDEPKEDRKVNKPSKDGEALKTRKDNEVPKTGKDVNVSKTSKDVKASKTPMDVEVPKPSKAVKAPKPSKDVEAPKPSKADKAPATVSDPSKVSAPVKGSASDPPGLTQVDKTTSAPSHVLFSAGGPPKGPASDKATPSPTNVASTSLPSVHKSKEPAHNENIEVPAEDGKGSTAAMEIASESSKTFRKGKSRNLWYEMSDPVTKEVLKVFRTAVMAEKVTKINRNQISIACRRGGDIVSGKFFRYVLATDDVLVSEPESEGRGPVAPSSSDLAADTTGVPKAIPTRSKTATKQKQASFSSLFLRPVKRQYKVSKNCNRLIELIDRSTGKIVVCFRGTATVAQALNLEKTLVTLACNNFGKDGEVDFGTYQLRWAPSDDVPRAYEFGAHKVDYQVVKESHETRMARWERVYKKELKTRQEVRPGGRQTNVERANKAGNASVASDAPSPSPEAIPIVKQVAKAPAPAPTPAPTAITMQDLKNEEKHPREIPVSTIEGHGSMVGEDKQVMLREPSSREIDNCCIVCQASRADVVFEPCHHCVLCFKCSGASCRSFCPVCRTNIHTRLQPVYARVVRPRIFSAYSFM